MCVPYLKLQLPFSNKDNRDKVSELKSCLEIGAMFSRISLQPKKASVECWSELNL
jgi:hypothetical protein